MNLVSIIVPVYNAERYLSRCLESLLRQSYKHIEIIIVDDGSNDSSIEIAKTYLDRDDRIVALTSEHKGVSVARNLGLRKAKGEYILFVDADDYVDKDYVGTLVTNILSEEADLAICAMADIFGENKSKRKLRGKIIGDFSQDYFYMIDFLCGPVAKLYKNSIIRKYDLLFPLNIDYAEDECFNHLYYGYVGKYVITDKTTYIYDHHSASLSDKLFLRNKKQLLAYLKKMESEKRFYDAMQIARKEELLGEHAIRAIVNFTDLESFEHFKDETKLIRAHIYGFCFYNKLFKTAFAWLLEKELYLLLFLSCKIRNFWLEETRGRCK